MRPAAIGKRAADGCGIAGQVALRSVAARAAHGALVGGECCRVIDRPVVMDLPPPLALDKPERARRATRERGFDPLVLVAAALDSEKITSAGAV